MKSDKTNKEKDRRKDVYMEWTEQIVLGTTTDW